MIERLSPRPRTAPLRLPGLGLGSFLRRAVATALPPVLLLALAIGGWWAYVRVANVKPYLAPSPEQVARRWFGDLGFFYGEGWVTLQEALGGLLVGSAAALALAVLLAHSRLLERAVMPVAVALKMTPVVAIAPMLTIWFGFGIVPRLLLAAIISFFPMLISGITGFRSVDPHILSVMRSLDASAVAVFFKVRLPSALPFIFSGLRISATLALIGATVAEWSNAGEGLGTVVWLAQHNIDMPTMVAAVLTLATLGVGLLTVIAAFERRLLFWHDSQRSRDDA